MNLNKTVFKFKFLDMPVSAPRSALLGSAILLVICTILAIWLTTLTPLDAFIAGILAVLIHWLSDFLHQYGHFFAAKQVGKPCTGLRMWWILGTTRYPADEGTLPPQIHVRRAIGGPIVSTIVLVISIILAYFWGSYSPMATFLLRWSVFINLFVFTLGALIPFKIGGFSTDGATLLQAWQDLRKQN